MRRLPTTLLALALTAATQAAAAPPVTADGPPSPPTAPVHPVSYSFRLSDNSFHPFGGGNAGILNITSFTFTNFSSTAQPVYIDQVSTTDAGCTGTVNGNGNVPSTTILVPAQQTIQLTFPTALQIAHFQGVSCIALVDDGNLGGGYVSVLINGLFTYKDGS